MGLAEERVHLDARQRIHSVANGIARMGIATHAVLGTKQCHEFDARRLVEDVNGALQVVVYAAGIGHQTHTLALQLGKAAVTQHFDTRLDDLASNRTCRHHHHHTQYQNQYLLHHSFF